jgi:hypothetical protein
MGIGDIKLDPLWGRKIQIGRRASLLRKDAERVVKSDRFPLGNNAFTVFRATRVGKNLVTALLCQLAAIFQGKFIGVWFEERIPGKMGVVVNVSDLRVKYPANRFSITEHDQRHIIFSLDFDIKGENLSLNRIESRTKRRGRGGNGLAMIHNLAQELQLKRIVFCVDYYKEDVKAFYHHMKFGQPENKDETFWVVDLRSAPKST